MKDPILKYCNKGHLYDGAIYASCPVCSGQMQSPVFEDAEDETEFAGFGYASGADSSNAPTLTYWNQPAAAAKTESNSIRSDSEMAQKDRTDSGSRKTAGWLVCVEPTDPSYGKALTLLEGENYICNRSGYTLVYNKEEADDAIFSILCDEEDCFWFQVMQGYHGSGAENGGSKGRQLINRTMIKLPGGRLFFHPLLGMPDFSWR